MAKIKTNSYLIEGQEIKVNFNCSTRGVFTAVIPLEIRQKLNICESKLESKSLNEIEILVNKAYSDYISSNTSLKLKIGVRFGAKGKFTRNSEGQELKYFQGYRNPYVIDGGFSSSFRSLIGLDFRVIMEENRNGVISNFDAVKLNPNRQVQQWDNVLDGYIAEGRIHSLNEGEKIIEFSQAALSNLIAITDQLRRASVFLAELVTDENFEIFINSENRNLLSI